jgi:pimeloyl-ACP methyl ester carboxylesterase
MAMFLFVPGAWLGGWCWRYVAIPLQAGGHTVIAATLTGLGERAHLLTLRTGLHTHVDDIVGLLHYRDLSGIILVGHSYGGTVITAVAEQVPERIRMLVYLDASVPRDGESNNDVVGPEMAAQLRADAQSSGEGWRVPPAAYVAARLPDAIRPWVEERLTPHPLRSFEEPVRLRSQAAGALPRAFIRSTQSALYDRLLDRAREAGWYCREISGGHYQMLTEPDAVAAALAELPP